MSEMDSGERGLSNGINITKIGQFDKFTVDSVSKNGKSTTVLPLSGSYANLYREGLLNTAINYSRGK